MIVKILNTDGKVSTIDNVEFIRGYVGIGSDNGVVYFLDSFIDDIYIEFEEVDYEKANGKEKRQKDISKHCRQKQKDKY